MEIIEFDKLKQKKESLNDSSIEIWEGFSHCIFVEYTIKDTTYCVNLTYHSLLNTNVFIENTIKYTKDDSSTEPVPVETEDLPSEIAELKNFSGSIKEFYTKLQNKNFDVKFIEPIFTGCFYPITTRQKDKVIHYALEYVHISEFSMLGIGCTKEAAESLFIDKTCSTKDAFPKFTLSVAIKSLEEQFNDTKPSCDTCKHKDECDSVNDMCDNDDSDVVEGPKLLLTILDSENEDDIITAVIQLLMEQCICIDDDTSDIWQYIKENMLFINSNVLEEHNHNVEEAMTAAVREGFAPSPDIFSSIILTIPNQEEQCLIPIRIEDADGECDSISIFRCSMSFISQMIMDSLN